MRTKVDKAQALRRAGMDKRNIYAFLIYLALLIFMIFGVIKCWNHEWVEFALKLTAAIIGIPLIPFIVVNLIFELKPIKKAGQPTIKKQQTKSNEKRLYTDRRN